MRSFLYKPEAQQAPVQVSLSVLPLHDDCTKVTVHGSYTTGCAFGNDLYMASVVLNVEAAIKAAGGGHAVFEPVLLKKKLTQRYRHVKHNTAVFISNALRVRRLSRPLHS